MCTSSNWNECRIQRVTSACQAPPLAARLLPLPRPGISCSLNGASAAPHPWENEHARDAMLDPDWLRIGTDIVGGTTPPTFNMAFTLNGTVPEPATMALMGLGLAAAMRRRFVARRTNRD